jgi:hypothetical protein
MQSATSLLLSFVCLFGGALANAGAVLGQEETVAEHYSLTIGTSSTGTDLQLFDKRFGDGTARARIKVVGQGESTRLSMRVSRNVSPGQIVFALLVFKVEVRGYDAAGALLFSEDFEGFTFGDSASGKWAEALTLPAEVVRIDATFFGNYE